MKSKNGLWVVISGLAIALAGCNLGAYTAPPDVNQAAATIVAKTLQAVPAGGSPEAENTPLASPNAIPSTSGAATLTINNPTNCRGGPGSDYQLITAFTPGTTLQIVGKDSAHNYWLVLIPKSQNTCWASGDYATASGNYQNLPEATPATVDQSIPTRPGNYSYSYECPGGARITNITWSDTANNETGFNVYRNGVLLVSLPANSSSYTDKTTVPIGSTVTYGISAFNQNGESGQRSFSFTCQ